MAFKMKGFSQHKGSKVHVGNHKSNAVFKKASAFKDDGHGGEPGHEHDITWGDWQEGETKTAKDGATTRQDQRTGVIKGGPDDYDGSGGYMTDTEWKAFLETPEGKEYQKKHGDREVQDTRTVETPGSSQDVQGWFGGRSGTSNIRVHGSATDVGYTGDQEVDPTKRYLMDQAISSWNKEIYKDGKFTGKREKVNFKDFEFYNEPEFQQLLTNINFEMAKWKVDKKLNQAAVDTKINAMKHASDTEYGKALETIVSAETPEEQLAAYEKVKSEFPELLREGGDVDVNPLQNQGSGQFATSGQARGAASQASGYRKLREDRTKSWI